MRRRLYAVVAECPGLSLADAAARAGLLWGSLSFHLNVLEEAGLVEVATAAGRRVLYPLREEASTPDQMVLLLPATPTRPIAQEVARNPGRPLSEVAARLGLSPCSVHLHVRRLRQAGLLHHPSAVGPGYLSPTPRLLALLGQVR